ncbi:hypothetical protein MOQ72_41830 [Saccharopolyspora sp. K220]|uniref:hypothetical protein n=1 Tax=Saccharopolyspora soli TaxID=2926618 RepID=UPI001F56F642|nr:hypothetical protein [Saccharopolyspora soli]MCI2423959.1 hypothetical protein [Saccharopolyspora soli]
MTEPHTSNTGRASLWPVGDDGRPKVRVGTNPDAIRVLTTAVGTRLLPDTYVQDGVPVVVEAVSGAGDPTAGDDDVALPLSASPLRVPLLASLLAEHTHVIRPEMDKEGNPTEVEVSPAGPVLSAVLARRSWPELPVLRRIISTPVLRPDGTLLQQPGYDPATGFLLASRAHLDPVPEHPTQEQVEHAREFLLERFLHDFPWRTPADRANYLGLLVTPIIRPFTRALSPFGVIDATMPGSGKTILSGCVGLLVGQRVLTWTDSEDELRKAITTVLADQVGVVVFDNLEEGAVINSAVLARLVTERTWTDRRLGSNTASTFPNDRLWLATGNNLRVGGDMASRTVWVRLDPDCPRPEARSGFTIPNLDTWILDLANQATVLRHVLTLILDWTANGAPTSTLVPQMRQFTRWAQHIGGFLEHHGITGFLGNAESARELDDDAAEWRAFLLRWHTLHGEKHLTANELRASAEPDWGTDPWVGSFPTSPTGKLPSAKSLGRRLTGQIGRWRGDVVLRSVTDTHTSSRVYWVERQPATPPPPESNPQTRKPAEPNHDQP